MFQVSRRRGSTTVRAAFACAVGVIALLPAVPAIAAEMPSFTGRPLTFSPPYPEHSQHANCIYGADNFCSAEGSASSATGEKELALSIGTSDCTVASSSGHSCLASGGVATGHGGMQMGFRIVKPLKTLTLEARYAVDRLETSWEQNPVQASLGSSGFSRAYVWLAVSGVHRDAGLTCGVPYCEGALATFETTSPNTSTTREDEELVLRLVLGPPEGSSSIPKGVVDVRVEAMGAIHSAVSDPGHFVAAFSGTLTAVTVTGAL